MDDHPLEFWLECHNLKRKWLCDKIEVSRSKISKVFSGKQPFRPAEAELIEEITSGSVTSGAMNKFYLNARN